MISVLLFFDEHFDAVAEVTLPWWEKYCVRHGYDLTVHRGGFGDNRGQISFQKSQMVRRMLGVSPWLVVADLDTLVTNQTIKFETFLQYGCAVYACEDSNGMNAGVYAVRDTFEGRGLMDYASHFASKAKSGEGDQNAIRDWISRNPLEYCCVPHPAFNSYLYEEYGETRTHEEGQWQPGDFLLHLPGMKNERRIELFRRHIPDIIQ